MEKVRCCIRSTWFVKTEFHTQWSERCIQAILEHIKSFFDELTVNGLSRQRWVYELTAKTNCIPNIPLTWHQPALGPAGHLHSNSFIFIRACPIGLYCSPRGKMKLSGIKLSPRMVRNDESLSCSESNKRRNSKTPCRLLKGASLL